MYKQQTYATVFSILWILASASISWSAGAATLDISPSSLKIGIFFSGSEIDLSGSILSDRDIIIEIIGPEGKGEFNLKAKVGPFWMNRKKVEIGRAPLFYGLLLPEKNPSDQEISTLGVGIENLKKVITIRADESSSGNIFDLFVQLKRSQELYVGPYNAIRYSQGSEGKKNYAAKFCFPSSIVQGEYLVRATIVHHGTSEDRLDRNLRVNETGIISGIHELAYRHSLIYGISAVLIALLVGTIMGVLFKGSKSH